MLLADASQRILGRELFDKPIIFFLHVRLWEWPRADGIDPNFIFSQSYRAIFSKVYKSGFGRSDISRMNHHFVLIDGQVWRNNTVHRSNIYDRTPFVFHIRENFLSSSERTRDNSVETLMPLLVRQVLEVVGRAIRCVVN